MKFTKYILPLVLIAICASSSRAIDVEAALKDRARAAKLPSSDTAVLYHGTTFTIHSDGKMDRQEHIIRYLRTDNAWDDYGDPHLAYDADRQELQVLVSRTYTADGRKIDTTPNGYNPMVPYGLDQAPDFTHYQQMVVTHLGIEYECVTELQYVIRDQQPLYPWGWGAVLFGGNEPILHRSLEVRVPAGLKLFTREENGAPQAVTHLLMNGEKQDVYVWEMKDLAARNLSEAGAKPNLSLPRVSFSACPDWTTLSSEINSRFATALTDLGSLPQDLSPLKEINNEQQKLDSVVAFVKNRLVCKTYDDQGFMLNFRPVGKTYYTGYGSPADLAALYAAALAEMEFQTTAMLAIQEFQPLAHLSGSEQFVMQVTSHGSSSWIYPNSGEIKYAPPQCATTVQVYPQARNINMQQVPPQIGQLRFDIGINFKEDQTAEGWIVIRQRGGLSGYEKAKSQDAETLVGGCTADLFAVPEIKEALITSMNPSLVELKADLSFPVPEEELDGLLRIEIPWHAGNADGFAPHGLALNYPARDLPLHLDHTGSFELNLQINYPDDWDVALAPASRDETANGISLKRSVTAEKGKLTFDEKVVFPSIEIAPKDWDGWRKVLLAADQASGRTILFKTETGETKSAKK